MVVWKSVVVDVEVDDVVVVIVVVVVVDEVDEVVVVVIVAACGSDFPGILMSAAGS